MVYSLDKKTEDEIKIKLIVDLNKLVQVYWDDLGVDGITVLSCVEQLSKYMCDSLIQSISKKMKTKFENGIGNDLETYIQNLDDITTTVKEDVKIGE